MNRRLVAKVLEKKHTDVLASIKEENVARLFHRDAIITGGSIASLLLNEPVNDYDYYFKTKETVMAVADYYIRHFDKKGLDIELVLYPRVKIIVKSAGVAGDNPEAGPDEDYMKQVLETPEEPVNPEKYRPVFMSANAITLSDKVQMVVRFYGEPDEIHKNYDFIHCCNYWTPRGGLVLHPGAIESLLSKHLIYQGSIYPVCSVIRTRKFLKQGWYINAGQYLKMCFQISELDLKDLEVLEEQLTGVDAAYFIQVINWCRKEKENNPQFEITTPYLCRIIDRIFG